MPDFLLEIGCEEIPARMIDAAAQELRDRVKAMLDQESLSAGELTHFDTPRRLTVMASGIPAAQPDVTEHITGPSVSVAYKEGKPTSAAHAFAKKAGVDVTQLEKISTTKGEYLTAKVTKKGRAAGEILAENLPKELSTIYWPKNMYWRKPNQRFVRPVRWLVAMLDDETIPLEFDGIWAGKTSRGHRVLSKDAVTIFRAGSAYVDALRAAKVLGRAEREQQMRKALDAATRTIPGARWREDKFLLDTVVNLTEFPSAILGCFDPQFLVLPEEVLVTVMRDHQKYFAVEDAGGKLLPHFLAVLNTDGDPEGLIRHGNERVLRARFNDARFFWETDQQRTLLERVELLRHVTFQKDLGTYYEKTRRVQRLCSWLSEIVKQGGIAVRPGVVHKAACLAKADLTTELVKEFTELQGVVGGLYARAQVLDPTLPEATRFAIADAIYDHYKPESTEDDVPRSLEGAILSVGDKADTIAGMFALGLVPSGSKDPFALRRQANAIVRVIAEKKLPFRLGDLMRDARAGYQGSEAEKKVVDDAKFEGTVRTFFRERLEFYLKDVCGYAYDVVKAVLAAGADDVVDALARAAAVAELRPSAEFESISVSFKRMKNIARQAEEAVRQADAAARVSLDALTRAAADADADGRRLVAELAAQQRSMERQFVSMMDEAAKQMQNDAERLLATQAAQIAPAVEAMRAARDYGGALSEVAKLRPTIDNYFDKVMVMVDDEKVRASRVALLQSLLKEFSTIADFSEIVTEGKA
jgi:glycyl-tRNA synthetase beta chain